MRKPEPINILVVDDEEEICKIFTKLLSAEGQRVKSVSTGRKAINIVKKEYFNVVFLDVVMPGIPAIEVLEKIEEISPKTKVVIITGKLMDSDLLQDLRRKGASSFLQKPFKIEDIKKNVSGLK